MNNPTLFIDGIALWAPTMPGWEAAHAALSGQGAPADPPVKRPAPQLLPPAERRRAPDTVALALEVASAAIAQSGQVAADVPTVFVSAHGDLGINDTMCRTLASDPTLLSPTKFHNSVHNAASGYWTIGTGCMHASTALTAFESSFAAGLLESAMQCVADDQIVLLVGYDIEACGALASVTRSRGLLAAALVLAPARSERSVAALDWSLRSGPVAALALHSAAARSLATNAMADALPLMEALAQLRHLKQGDPLVPPVQLPLTPALSLDIQLRKI